MLTSRQPIWIGWGQELTYFYNDPYKSIIGGGFDAAIIDIGLPDRQGDVLATEVRALYPSLPLVIASGRNEEHLRARFAQDRKVFLLPKPYAAEQLYAALASIGLRMPPQPK